MRILQEVCDIERSHQLVICEKKKQDPIKTNMEFKWGEVFSFISEGSYPLTLNRGQRQTLRKYAVKFSIHAGDLFYGALPERRAVRSKEEAWNLFKEFHASPMGGHTGIIKTHSATCSRFYWPGMTADIEKWVSQCDRCQRVGPPLQVVRELECIKMSGVWELIGIDLTGPMPLTSCGNQYILTATDYFSKWVEAFPLKTKTAEEVCQKLCSIFYRHGCPQRILTDQGREFVNTMNSRLCDLLSIQRSITAAYHPQTNGLDEKTNDNIKRALRKLINDKQNDWDMFLEATLFSLRSKTHTITKYSPFFLMYGREARFPSEVPVDMPLSSVVLPEDYSQFVKDRDNRQQDTKIQVEENVELAKKKEKSFCESGTKKIQTFQVHRRGESSFIQHKKKG
uniref:Gypsy retrotransposon integrase-like protein 1 n=1 Tax=Poecilia reticulata TaxID=8081 RepID=A0A3P9PWV5_POERE